MTRARAVAAALAALLGILAASAVGAGSAPSALGLTLLLALVVVGAPTGDSRPATPLPGVVGWTWILPPLALAWSLDRARGADPAVLDPVAGLGALLLLGWCLLAARALPAPVRALRGAVLFGGPLLALSLVWAGAGAEAEPRGWTTALASTSPLGWAYLAARAVGGSGAPPGLLGPATAVALLALAGVAGRQVPARVGVLCLLSAVSATSARAGEQRLSEAELEFVGPLAGAVVEVPGGGRATITLRLGAGERRTARVPLPIASPAARDLLADPTPLAIGGAAGTAAASGRVRFLGWLDDHAARARWAALPPGLTARPRPRPDAVRAMPRPWAPLACGALLVLAAGAARGATGRARAGRLGSAAGAVVLAGLLATGVGVAPVGSSTIELVDVDLRPLAPSAAADGERVHPALRVRAGAGALRLGPGEERVETAPEGAALEVELDLGPGGDGRARVRAPGATVQALTPIELRLPPTPADRLEAAAAALAARGVGGAGRLARDPDGGWPAEAADWPAWSTAGLPFGRDVLLLRPGDGRAWGRVLR